MVRIQKGSIEKNKQRFLESVLGKGSKFTAVVGLSKNAGKTTLLNWLVKNAAVSKPGIITTGRDGEDIDLVGGHKKPKVIVPAGAFYSTFANVISRHSANLEVVAKLPFRVTGRELWLVKALTELKTEVVGPSTVREQISLANIILAEGAEHVFIDGSLDRKSIALSPQIESIVVVVSPVFGKLKKIVAELTRLYELTQIPRISDVCIPDDRICYCFGGKTITLSYKSLFGNEKQLIQVKDLEHSEWIYLPGAITSKSFAMIKPFLNRFKGKLIFKHPLHIRLNGAEYDWLKNHVTIFSRQKIRIDGIAINSYAVNGNHLDCELLRNEIRGKFKQLPVIDVTEAG